jgi:hypothetical protein
MNHSDNEDTNKLFFPKCILCGKELSKKVAPEHVIPDSLGGRLKVICLCDECNHGISAKLYSQFKFDYLIRKSGMSLKGILPKIYEGIEKRQNYVTKGPLGTDISAYKNGNIFNLVQGKQKDGSFILPTKNVSSYLKSLLQTDIPEKDLEDIVYGTPNNQIKEISNGFKIVRWDANYYNPDFSKNKLVDTNVPLLMAFEYLSLIIGGNIYFDVFNEARRIIGGEIKDSKLIEVEQLVSKNPQPFHRIYPEYLEKEIIIHIWLFEYVVYKVIFKNVSLKNIEGNEIPYLEDLVNKKSYISRSVEEAKKDIWFEYANH